MLKLKNGYWTLNKIKYFELTATGQLVFKLLLDDKKNNSIMLCNKNKTLSLRNLKKYNYEFR
jgi:hypothetical protein